MSSTAHRLIDDRGGSAAVEFALLAPVLLLLLAALVDLSRLVTASMQVRSAAQAGADWAQRRGWDAVQVQAAMTGASGLPGLVARVPAEPLRACVVDGVVTPRPIGACASAGVPGQFVTVTTEAPFTGVIPWPGALLPERVSGTATVRIR